MTFDISSAIKNWDFDPDDMTVRTITGDDGLEKIQLRLDLGVLQIDINGRPDGQKIEGHESLLDLHETRQREHDSEHQDDVPYLLEAEDCSQLMREGVQYYHRYVSLWHLNRYELCARDTERNLRLFDFVRSHAQSDHDKMQFDQWRPYVIMMHTRAVAMPLTDTNQQEAAILVVESGIERIRQFLADYGQAKQADNVNELTFLKRWRRKLIRGDSDQDDEEMNEDNDPLQSLEEELQAAIEKEDYEKAALLRDQLNRLENPPPPGN